MGCLVFYFGAMGGVCIRGRGTESGSFGKYTRIHKSTSSSPAHIYIHTYSRDLEVPKWGPQNLLNNKQKFRILPAPFFPLTYTHLRVT